VDVDEHTIDLDALPVYYRSTSPMPGATPVYLHGIPTSSDDWIEFLARSGGIAPDFIGFGRSAKGGHLDYSVDGLTDFLEDFLTHVGVDEVQIVGHDWGAAVGLKFARRHPERVRRLVLSNAPALVEGFEWPRIIRWWQTRGLGEALMGSFPRPMFARTLRKGSVDPGAWSQKRIDDAWEQFDQGTQRAVLRLVRSAPENMIGDTWSHAPVRSRALESGGAEPGATESGAVESAAGESAGVEIPPVETTLIWGEEDPWYPPALADAYAARLPGASVERVAGAGHWPWLDRPEVVERVAALLEG